MTDNQKEYIVEASRKARQTGTIYLTFVAYSVLTIFGVSDRQLVLNEIVRLPIVNSEVPLSSYYVVSPVVILVMYCYFQFQLYMATSAINRSGSSTSEFSCEHYPWIVYCTDCTEPGIIGWLQRAYVNLAIWWSLPLVLLLFATTILKKHAAPLAVFVGLLSLVGLGLVILFQHKQRGVFRQVGFIRMILVFAIFNIALLVLLIPLANSGKRWPPKDYGGFSAALGSFLVADLRGQVLVRKPDNDYKNIYWTELSDIHLEGADLTASILSRADLRRANLQRAIAFSADIDGANLSRANMAYVLMSNSILEHSILETANFAGALLIQANLRYSSPMRSNFQGAVLVKADLEGANFDGSSLEGADLTEAILHKTNFRGSNLRRIVAEGADFAEANLEDAFLDEAYLMNARNLTIEQLSKAATLFKAILPLKLKAQVERTRPDLLEPPNDALRPKIKFEQLFPGYAKGPDWSRRLGKIE